MYVIYTSRAYDIYDDLCFYTVLLRRSLSFLRILVTALSKIWSKIFGPERTEYQISTADAPYNFKLECDIVVKYSVEKDTKIDLSPRGARKSNCLAGW